jgi:hypothetical protein
MASVIQPKTAARSFGVLLAFVGLVVSLEGSQKPAADSSYLSWTASKAREVGGTTRVNGRVGGMFDFRIINTDHAFNYKLRATWLTRDVIQAAARLAQLADRLAVAETEALVAEAEAVRDTVIMVEIDPREGSGVIPLDWLAVLQPKGLQPDQPGAVRGTVQQKLRQVRALSGVFRRDYAYDVFWVVFPLVTESGQPLFSASTSDAELVVRIHGKEGRVGWPVPAAIRR